MLLKYGVPLETVKEKFGEDAMSKAILSLRAMFVEVEVEQSKMRMSRGRADRIVIGQATNGHPYAAYGYCFIDTEKEVKGAYEAGYVFCGICGSKMHVAPLRCKIDITVPEVMKKLDYNMADSWAITIQAKADGFAPLQRTFYVQVN